MRNITGLISICPEIDLADRSGFSVGTGGQCHLPHIHTEMEMEIFCVCCRLDVDLAPVQEGEKGEGKRRRTELEKAGRVGKKEKHKKRARRGLETL